MHSRNYRARQGETYRARMRARRTDLLASMTIEQQVAFRKAEADKMVKVSAKLRKEVFEAYGGYKCACCGERQPAFLSIDHIDNNGAAHRREIGIGRKSAAKLYWWLRKNKYPKGFQVLCMNCNFGKHRNGGVCPHQVRRNDHPERE